MIGLIAVAFAVALALMPVFAMPVPAVAIGGLGGLLLTTAAVIAGWRWPATVAACVFLAEYAAALAMAAAPMSVIASVGFGLALLLLLQSVDLACRVRGATCGWRIVLREVGRWIGLGIGALGTAALALTLARPLAAILPPSAAPLLAAGGALGAVLIAATVVVRAARNRRALAR
jgi:hypothetical protein